MKIYLFAAIMLAGCYQPHKTVYKQPLVRGYNDRWVKAGEKELCAEPCKMTLVTDPKNYKGDTLWLYSKRN